MEPSIWVSLLRIVEPIQSGDEIIHLAEAIKSQNNSLSTSHVSCSIKNPRNIDWLCEIHAEYSNVISTHWKFDF